MKIEGEIAREVRHTLGIAPTRFEEAKIALLFLKLLRGMRREIRTSTTSNRKPATFLTAPDWHRWVLPEPHQLARLPLSTSSMLI